MVRFLSLLLTVGGSNPVGRIFIPFIAYNNSSPADAGACFVQKAYPDVLSSLNDGPIGAHNAPLGFDFYMSLIHAMKGPFLI